MVVSGILWTGNQTVKGRTDRQRCLRATSLDSHRVTGTYPKVRTWGTCLHGNSRLIFSESPSTFTTETVEFIRPSPLHVVDASGREDGGGTGSLDRVARCKDGTDGV